MTERDKSLKPYPAGPAGWDVFVDNLSQQFRIPQVTSASISARGSFINSPQFKDRGTVIYNVTQGYLMFAIGSTSVGEWKVIDISGSTTPA